MRIFVVSIALKQKDEVVGKLEYKKSENLKHNDEIQVIIDIGQGGERG